MIVLSPPIFAISTMSARKPALYNSLLSQTLARQTGTPHTPQPRHVLPLVVWPSELALKIFITHAHPLYSRGVSFATLTLINCNSTPSPFAPRASIVGTRRHCGLAD